MKLFSFRTWDDFGLEVRLKLLKFKPFTTFAAELNHSCYFDWREPNISVSIGLLGRSNLFGISVHAWNISIRLSLFQWNLYYDKALY
jgi:hypothetical protein